MPGQTEAPMGFYLKPPGGLCTIRCTDNMRGYMCMLFRLEGGMVNPQTRAVYEKLVECNGSDWPIYNEVQAHGGTLTLEVDCLR